MSTENVHSIISRAVRDASFRGLLFSDPGVALSGYALTDAEVAALRGITPDNLDSMAVELEERISRASFGVFREEEMKFGASAEQLSKE